MDGIMGKPRGIKLIGEKEPVVHKLVFELCYDHGYTYLDRCGATLNSIMRERPHWIMGDAAVSPQGAPLMNTNNNSEFHFSSLSMAFSIEQGLGMNTVLEDQLQSFFEEIEPVSGIVQAELGLTTFTRIGLRTWYLFGCDNKEEAEKWIEDLDCFRVSPKLSEAFHGTLNAAGFSAVIDGGDRCFRLAVHGVERSFTLNMGKEITNISPRRLSKDQQAYALEKLKTRKEHTHRPHFAAMIDIDAYQEMPTRVEPSDFAISSFEQGLDCLYGYMDE